MFVIKKSVQLLMHINIAVMLKKTYKSLNVLHFAKSGAIIMFSSIKFEARRA
jgi:hypothetical protein